MKEGHSIAQDISRRRLLGQLGVTAGALIPLGRAWSFVGCAEAQAQGDIPQGISAPAWTALPGSALAQAVWPAVPPMRGPSTPTTLNALKGYDSWGSQLTQWCGAAYRYDTDEMWFLALGGHWGGGSNEVWVVNCRTGAGRRDFDPTVDLIPVSGGAGGRGPFLPRYTDDRGQYGPAGKVWPSSRHSYGGVIHIPGTDKIWLGGGVYASLGWSTTDVFLYDTASHTYDWQDHDPIPHSDPGIVTAWDPIQGRILAVDYSTLYEWKYSRPVGSRTAVLAPSTIGNPIQYRNMLFDEKRNRLVIAGLVGGAQDNRMVVTYIDLANRSVLGTLIAPGKSMLPPWSAPGFERDAENDRYLVYHHGDALYWINPDTGSVTREVTTGAPDPASFSGTGSNVAGYGRWGQVRYSRNLRKVFTPFDFWTGMFTVTPAAKTIRN